MIVEDNAQAARQTEAQIEEECQEVEEIEAAKDKSLRMAKQEKKRRKAQMRTKHRQEDTSTSAIPQVPAPTTLTLEEAKTPITTLKMDEWAQPMYTK